ncbi:50S ribosomal protein L27 [[Mycoplasma] testudinis]|uniref:50S ribosomal protein L27 n=1 Tax=[Mycoplasma] testudinis TaxID=33924 RepID=UPI00048118E3|nr:50S ribosomal protein L27 [[Mycoplasma] testudinis]
MNNKKIWLTVDLQYFASKKGVGSTKNGRDSNPKFLGAKLADGQHAKIGQIIYRQRGNRIWPGRNVGQGTDDTLFAKAEGTVRYTKFGAAKTKVEIVPSKVE